MRERKAEALLGEHESEIRLRSWEREAKASLRDKFAAENVVDAVAGCNDNP